VRALQVTDFQHMTSHSVSENTKNESRDDQFSRCILVVINQTSDVSDSVATGSVGLGSVVADVGAVAVAIVR
jgi:hypothetical protein